MADEINWKLRAQVNAKILEKVEIALRDWASYTRAVVDSNKNLKPFSQGFTYYDPQHILPVFTKLVTYIEENKE